MRGTAALGAGGRGQTQMGAVSIVEGAVVGSVLPGRVEHQDVQHQLQLALGKGTRSYVLNTLPTRLEL